jgi:hypothetical protein
MSIAGMLDAMRSSYSPAVRLVWQCVENHANSARFWTMTDEDIAQEMHLSVDTVGRAVNVLERDRICRCVRRKRRPTTFHMLRHYPPGRPRHEPEVERHVAPELTSQIPELRPELTPQIPETLSPPERKNPPEKEERAAPASPPPAPSPFPVQCLPEQERRRPEPPPSARKTLLPDDWAPPAEVRQLAIEAGYDPAEIMTEMADWCRHKGAQSADWTACARNWIRREGKLNARRPKTRTEREAEAIRMHAQAAENIYARRLARSHLGGAL